MILNLGRRPRLSLRLMLALIAVVAIALGLLSYRIKKQQESVLLLRELGGQLESPVLDLATWIMGMSIDSVQFLGPRVGDQAVSDIGNASASLRVKRMTFLETRVTQRGLHQLQAVLPDVEIQLVTPSPGMRQGMPIQKDRR
jgi:hypothetical protein